MIKNKMTVISICTLVISCLLIGCSVGNEQSQNMGGLKVHNWSSGLGSVNNSDLDKTKFIYTIYLTNEDEKEIHVKSILPIVNESIKSRVLSKELAVEFNKGLKPEETTEIKGEIIVDTKGMTKMDIEDLGPFITDIKISNEEIIKLISADTERVETDNSESGDSDTANNIKSDADVISSFITDDVDQLLSLYYEEIDGAFAEGYASNLLRLFKKTDLRIFVQKMSEFERQKVVGILSLLISEFSVEEDNTGIDDLDTKLEEMRSDKNLTPQERYIVYEALAQIKYSQSSR